MFSVDDAVGLVLNPKRQLKIDNNLIQAGLSAQTPWTEPRLRAVQITDAKFAPEGDQAFVIIKGSVQAPDLVIKGVRAPIEVGFELKMGGTLRYDATKRDLYITVTDFDFTKFNPAEGLGLAGDLALAALGFGSRSVASTGRAVGRGASSLWNRLPSLPRPRLPKRLRRKKSAPEVDEAPQIEEVVATTPEEEVQAAAIEEAGGKRAFGDALVAKLKGWIISAVNAYLDETPIYQLPREYQGIDLSEVVEDVFIEDGQVTVQLDIDKSPQLRQGRSWIKWAVIGGAGFLLVGAMGWGMFLAGLFQ